MDILKIPLIIIFKEQNPYRILQNYFINNENNNHSRVDTKKFIYLSHFETPENSIEEIENLLGVVEEKMEKKLQGQKFDKSVFNLLIDYAENMLDDLGNNVQCKYKNLLKWRMTSHKLDQDLFITCFFAYRDLLIGRERRCFDWDTTIKSNNIRLHNMLSKGMAENHFHLKGSAPSFNFSWISIMNNIRNRNLGNIKLEENRLEPDFERNVSISDSVVIAAFLRVILFKYFYGISVTKDVRRFADLLQVDTGVSNMMIKMTAPYIQNEINILKHMFGKDIMYKNNTVKVDYALTNDIDTKDISTRLFAGERSLMYKCFQLIYKGDEGFKKIKDLFYAYIIIKSKFRGELVQVNERVGFSNFADYQDRKSQFIPKNTILNDSVESTAILTSIKNQKILSLEARVTPSYLVEQNVSEIKRIDSIVCHQIFNDKNNAWMKKYKDVKTKPVLSISKQKILGNEKEQQIINKIKDNYFYVFHFPKKRDQQCDLKYNEDNDNIIRLMGKCRHSDYRKDLKKYAFAIYNMREKNYDEAKRVLGIDACSNELVMRPEVFGQTFRFLKAHLISEGFQKAYIPVAPVSRLRATFHVGEDFLDIADGLRAIDECVKFLNLTHGDRLGHAIVLGIDVDDWYRKKQFKVNITKQAILDNVAWLIMKIREFDIDDGATVIEKLVPIYNKYFLEIFDNSLVSYINNQDMYINLQVIPVDTYMEAWNLRGDNPEYYIDDKMKNGLSYWERCAKRKYEFKWEDSSLVENIYMNYHYNPQIKLRGYKKEVFKIQPYMVEVIKKIQKEMQIYIRERGIGIECNPSSNYLISNFKRYDKHPILNMYNLGLTIDENEAQKYPQLFVSINTDDQGVFGTLLENEYALMGIALEKAKDAKGKPLYNQSMIYDWLDRVRRMGVEQSFGLNSSNIE